MSGVLVVTVPWGQPRASAIHPPNGGRDDELQGAEQGPPEQRATPTHEAPVRLTGKVGLGHNPMWGGRAVALEEINDPREV